MLSVKPRPKSPLMVPGAASNDLVEPTMSLTVFTALLPSRMHATTVPDMINDNKSSKNGLSSVDRVKFLGLFLSEVVQL